MSREFLILVCILFLTACIPPDRTPLSDSAAEKSGTIGRNYIVKIIDGCEYIEFNQGSGNVRVYSLTHKGDCRNPIHHHCKP